MIENDILLDENPIDLLKILFKNSVLDELNEKNYKINYFGERTNEYLDYLIEYYSNEEKCIENIQNISINQSDERNNIIYIKYRNIYIGGLSIFDFKSREGFGLNKYVNNEKEIFYLGQWRNNKKWGIGFLRLDSEHLFFGNFKDNQMYGEGLYFNKSNKNIFFGLFNNGEIKKGLCYNLKKNAYYIGKFVNSKKNDDFSIYINYEYKRIFIGQIKSDIFIKGYIIFLKLEKTKNHIVSKIKNVIYKNNEKYSRINIGQNKYLEQFVFTIIDKVNKLNILFENGKQLLLELEKIYNDNTYNNRIGRYNSTENSFSFEKELINDYNKYFCLFKNIQGEFNLQNMKKIIII